MELKYLMSNLRNFEKKLVKKMTNNALQVVNVHICG